MKDSGPVCAVRRIHGTTPDLHGEVSMKSVLPALTGKGYGDLDIQEGGKASNEFNCITFGDVDDIERQKVRLQLERYCKLDTEGMIYILAALEQYLK